MQPSVVFAHCGKPLGESPFGTGSQRDGVFCGLSCYSKFYEDYYLERSETGRISNN